jgi:amino acid transporter
MFSMARDGRLPFAKALSRVSPRTHTPLLPGFVVCALAIGVLWINYGEPGVFGAVTSVSVVVVYVAYLLVTGPLLYRRLTGHPVFSKPDTRHFNLGRWGTSVNVVAVVFGLGLLLDVGWPRVEVYDPAGGHWYLQYFAPLFMAASTMIGAVAYVLMQRQQARQVALAAAE